MAQGTERKKLQIVHKSLTVHTETPSNCIRNGGGRWSGKDHSEGLGEAAQSHVKAKPWLEPSR